MKSRLPCALVVLALVVLAGGIADPVIRAESAPPPDPLFAAFQNPSADAKPFAYWWWKGNAATEPEISRQLELLRQAGFAGAHIVPLGKPAGTVDWLSPAWWRLVRFAVDEAGKRGMAIDINAGYGWPSGGPFVKPEHRLQAISCVTEELAGPRHYEKTLDDLLSPNLDGERTFAFARLVPRRLDRFDQIVDLREHIRGRTLSFDLPAGDFVLYAGIHRLNARRLKVSGKENDFALDYFNRQGVEEYLAHFAATARDALGTRLGDSFHAFFVSSVEIWPANWTTGFADEFRRRRGYDLMPYAPFVTGMYPIPLYQAKNFRPDPFTASPEVADEVRRVRYDYAKTLVELFQENFVETTQRWCRGQGLRFRYQAYGFPWNIGIAENYLVPDIPEGNNWVLSDVADHGWEVWNLYAAAGGHLTGKHVISNEAMTTTKGKFRETLDIVKRADDFNFITGNTRSVVHGFCYSPASAPPPGWDQYGTFLSEHNPWWPYLPRWTRYNARLSQLFQRADPVIDIAILCPTADVWSDFGLNRVAQQTKPRYGYKLWESLSQQGLGADYLHEAVIRKAGFADGRLGYGPMHYRLLVLCDVGSLEAETAEAIERYVRAGGRLVRIGKPPTRSPSLTDAAARNRRVKAAFDRAERAGSGRVTFIAAPDETTDLLTWTGELLRRTHTVAPMSFSAPSRDLFQIHYRAADRDIVFLCNQSTERRAAGRLEFPAQSKTVWCWNPETGTRAIYPTEAAGALSLDLAPAESLLLVWEPDRNGPKHLPPLVAGGEVLAVTTPWTFELRSFRGGQTTLTDQRLIDFAESPTLNRFAGTIEYETTFELAPGELMRSRILDLGKINGVSEAWLNGRSLGVRWYGLHQYAAAGLKAGRNQLRVKVATLLFNGVGSASEPRESTGMPGPVRLREAQKMSLPAKPSP